MDENSALIEAILREEQEGAASLNDNNAHGSGDTYGWKTVSYQKKTRKPSKPSTDTSAAVNLSDSRPNGFSSCGSEVFRSIELHSEERRRRVLEAQKAIAAASVESVAAGSKQHSDDDEDDDSDAEVFGAQNGGGAEPTKKVKAKKRKKPKVTVAEAALKIDADHLGSFIAEITVSHSDNSTDLFCLNFVSMDKSL